MGDQTGLTLSLGQRVTVRLAEAVPVTGGLVLDLLTLEDNELPRGPRTGGRPGGRRTGPPKGRKPGPAKVRKDATSRKLTRRKRER